MGAGLNQRGFKPIRRGDSSEQKSGEGVGVQVLAFLKRERMLGEGGGTSAGGGVRYWGGGS